MRGVVPTLSTLARRGLLDGRVLAAVLRLAGKDAPEAADERADAWRTETDACVAAFVREALDPGEDPETGEWKPVRLTPAGLEDIDQRDREALEAVVLRVVTPEQVTARVEAGLSPMEGAGELDRLAEFRDDGPRAAAGGDGEDVGRQAVAAAAGA